MPVRTRQDLGATSIPKKRKVDHTNQFLSPIHPHGVKPSGNALIASHSIRVSSLGHLSIFSDEEILFIFSLLGPEDWSQLQKVSHACRAFALYEPHWRDATIALTGGKLKCWRTSWKETYVEHACTSSQRSGNKSQGNRKAPIRVEGLFSDALFLPLQLALSPLDGYIPHRIASRRAARSLEKVKANVLGSQAFMEQYARQGKPCLIVDDDSLASLPCWKLADLKSLYPKRRIRSEALTMTMDCYTEYAKSCQEAEHWIPDESPFYLFDPTLARSMQKQGSFIVPAILRNNGSKDQSTMRKDWDLFSLLQEQRPDHAWVIAGPGRSGSGWHVDPNGTSAYNTVLSGQKLWMLLPPNVTPPGVFISSDGSSVTAPLSIIEWLIHFWEACIRLHGRGGDDTLIVDVCSAGKTVFVPAGWRHLVINLDESVAFTQNFCSTAELPAVLDFLKNRPEQISGFRMPRSRKVDDDEEDGSDLELDELPNDGISEKRALFDLFVDRLNKFDPALLEKGLQEMYSLQEQKKQEPATMMTTTIARSKRESANETSSSLWDTLKKEEGVSSAGFAFEIEDDD